MHKPTNIL